MSILSGETTALILFFIGLFGLTSRRQMLVSIISIGIIDVSVVVFFLTMFANVGDTAPIGVTQTAGVTDPLPQAMMITAIVIGVAVTAISLVMVINLHHKYGTSDWKKAKDKRMESI